MVPLDAPAARSAHLGAKAANLATARAARLPVVDGFVLAPDLAAHLAGAPRPGEPGDHRADAVRQAWAALSRNGSDPVVVRSSSRNEDTGTSSNAGVYESVVDVRGWDDFLDAVGVVVRSAARVDGPGASLPVLVQRHVEPAWGGVMFGVDPVTGRGDRLVLAAVAGGPQQLVAGADTGTRLVLDRHGRTLEGPRGRRPLGWAQRRRLAELAVRVERLYGGPQDVEWAITDDGEVLLLQSRPVTATGAEGTGPVLGPGPLAETFPDPLARLEQDLWIPPLSEALTAVLPLTGRASARRVARSPVVAVLDGRPAVDLDVLEPPARPRGLARLDPRPPLRRLRVAWRVGRLRAGLTLLVAGVLADLDRDLAAVPSLGELTDAELLGVLHRTRAALRAAHGYELLAGVLVTGDDGHSATAAEVALHRLAAARRAGATSDAEVVAATPEVLALVPPAIAVPAPLPVEVPDLGEPGPLSEREALRLRIRWLHELGALAARELGQRLAGRGLLGHATDVAGVGLDDLAAALRHGTPPAVAPRTPTTPPLPTRFRLTAEGTPVAVVDLRDRDAAGTGAGGGRGTGTAHHGDGPPAGAVLVVATLDPRLAPVLDRLGGLVAETGSPLSHLAILAREHGVPTVVGVPGALTRYPAGTELLVDGSTGDVTVLLPAAGTAAPS